MDKDKQKKSGLATAGMVLGIIAIAGAWIPFLNVVSIILAVLAVIFGGVSLLQKKGKGKAVTAIVLGVLSIVIAIFMLSVATKAVDDAINNSDTGAQSSAEANNERLTLDDGWKLDTSNQYMTQVVGTVSNNSDKDIDGYIQITFSAYDADGANVGDCLANANTVDANGTWKFKAACSGDGIKTVEFKELTGF